MNDLNLELTENPGSAAQRTHLGNNDPEAWPNHLPDALNNVEKITLKYFSRHDPSTSVRIRVTGAHVMAGSQRYSLVVTGLRLRPMECPAPPCAGRACGRKLGKLSSVARTALVFLAGIVLGGALMSLAVRRAASAPVSKAHVPDGPPMRHRYARFGENDDDHDASAPGAAEAAASAALANLMFATADVLSPEMPIWRELPLHSQVQMREISPLLSGRLGSLDSHIGRSSEQAGSYGAADMTAPRRSSL